MALIGSYVRTNLRLPEEFQRHTLYSADEVQALLWDSSDSLLGPNWILVYINVRYSWILLVFFYPNY